MKAILNEGHSSTVMFIIINIFQQKLDHRLLILRPGLATAIYFATLHVLVQNKIFHYRVTEHRSLSFNLLWLQMEASLLHVIP